MYMKYIAYFTVIALVLLIAGCAAQTEYLAKTKYLTENEAYLIEKEKTIWVTTKTGAEYKIDNPKIANSKIIGFSYGESKEISFNDIAFVKINKENKEQIILATAVGLAEIGLFIGCLVAPPIETCCPFIYSFDGNGYILDSILLHSAIVKDGTDYAKLEHIVLTDGKIQIKMTNEMNETDYTDELKLLSVDHPITTSIMPDMTGKIHTIASQIKPSSAYELSGRNILDLVEKKDGSFWGHDQIYESLDEVKSSILKELLFDFRKPKKDLIIEFPKPKDAKTAKLVMNVCNTAYGINKGTRFLKKYGDWDTLLKLSLILAREEVIRFDVEVFENGHWKTRGYIHGGNPIIPRDQIAVLDVRDVKDDKLRLRLPITDGYWMINSAFIDYSEDAPVKVTELQMIEAIDNNGRNIKELLKAEDDIYYIEEKGDYVNITFNETPPVSSMNRSFVIKARGYYKVYKANEYHLAKAEILTLRREQ